MGLNDLKSIIESKGSTKSVNSLNKNNVADNIQEFKDLLSRRVSDEISKSDIKLSNHARKRLEQRDLDFDGNEFLKIKDAIGKLKEKGGHDSLVITDKAAYIVDVDNETVVTAIDKAEMSENVFTKIDSTYFVN